MSIHIKILALTFSLIAPLILATLVSGDTVNASASMLSEDKLEFVTSVGRATLDSPEDTTVARRRALDDALYLASLQGGAKVNGFSAVGTGTELTDNFVVRPTTKILDYAILKEVIKETHYEVTIRAAIGSLNQKNCKNGNLVNITAYKPSLSLSPTAPAWLGPVLTQLYLEMLKSIESRPNVEISRAYDVALNSKTLQATNDLYDYTSLTAGRVRTNVGSFAYVPKITAAIQNNTGSINNETTLIMEITSTLYYGLTYSKAYSKSHQISLKLSNNSPWRMINILSKPSKSLIIETLVKSTKKHTDALFSEFECQPLQADMQLDNSQNNLIVRLGKKHGLTLSSLAYTKGTNTPWILFRVVSLTNNTSVLTPLDPRRDISNLEGKIVEFLEVL
ncbi:MAG: flagellar assembly protein T N-terminal domain-containing protein [Paracoccaceae bacterium]